MSFLSDRPVGVLSGDVDEKAAKRKRNGKDFADSPVPAISPTDLLKQL